MERVYEFLKRAGIYYLATDEDGQPRVRPFGTVDLFGGRLYIQTGRRKDCYRQIKKNPRIELCASVGGEWLRLSAVAVENTDVEAERHLLSAYPELREMYQPGDGNTVLFALTDADARICSFTAPTVEIRF